MVFSVSGIAYSGAHSFSRVVMLWDDIVFRWGVVWVVGPFTVIFYLWSLIFACGRDVDA